MTRTPGDHLDPLRRTGHVVAAAVAGVLLWSSHQLLGWGWPSFLTEDFRDVLGLLTLSFVASIVMHLALAVRPGLRLRALGELVTNGYALAVCLRLLVVFPFAFTGTDWSWLLRGVLVVGVVGTGVGMVGALVTLLAGDPPSTTTRRETKDVHVTSDDRSPERTDDDRVIDLAAPPSVLVAHASRHGSTAGIADRVAERLRTHGLHAVSLPVEQVEDVADWDAVVIGGAAYMFHWLRPATAFAHANADVLSRRPVWLFSSGPVGDETVDADGNDLLEVSRPREFDELHALLDPRDEKVFYGAWDPEAPPVGFAERLMKMVPASTQVLPTGDFRDWDAIDAWADGIAAALGADRPADVGQPIRG